MLSEFGRLTKVPLREGWLSEPQDFTPWMADPENLSLLGDAIGIELSLEAREKPVGPFRADLLCRDAADGTIILIENQLERSDHLHLGQIITYAAGLQAVTIVWVAERFTEEHRAACDWLNQITGPEFRVFALEVELWRIGDSRPAPKFNVRAQPNDWVKTTASTKQTGEIDTSKAWIVPYWEALLDVVSARGFDFGGRIVPRASYWLKLQGKPGAYVLDAVLGGPGRVSAVLTLMGLSSSARFQQMVGQRASLASWFDDELVCEEKPGVIRPRFRLSLLNADPKVTEDWPRQHAWLADALQGMAERLVPIIPEHAGAGSESNE
jgi:hypothetical protein